MPRDGIMPGKMGSWYQMKSGCFFSRLFIPTFEISRLQHLCRIPIPPAIIGDHKRIDMFLKPLMDTNGLMLRRFANHRGELKDADVSTLFDQPQRHPVNLVYEMLPLPPLAKIGVPFYADSHR